MSVVFRKPKLAWHKPYDWVVFYDSDIAGFVRKVPAFYIGRNSRVEVATFVAYDEHGARLGEFDRRIDAGHVAVRAKHGRVVPAPRKVGVL